MQTVYPQAVPCINYIDLHLTRVVYQPPLIWAFPTNNHSLEYFTEKSRLHTYLLIRRSDYSNFFSPNMKVFPLDRDLSSCYLCPYLAQLFLHITYKTLEGNLESQNRQKEKCQASGLDNPQNHEKKEISKGTKKEVSYKSTVLLKKSRKTISVSESRHQNLARRTLLTVSERRFGNVQNPFQNV